MGEVGKLAMPTAGSTSGIMTVTAPPRRLDEMQAMIAAEIIRWKQLIKEANIPQK